MTEFLLRRETVHYVPQCWKLFNKLNNVQRGLFFLEGSEWQIMRKKMNTLFLKHPGVDIAQNHSQSVTDQVLKQLRDLKVDLPFTSINTCNLQGYE